MKIIKRELKFDMVLDGEKINSLDELREHPSTELLELQKDGRLSRWLRAHGGTNEADTICEMSFSGDTARDLYAICQVLAVDIELEDIIDALKDESSKDTVPACDSVEEEYCKYTEEDPEIKQRRGIFLNSAGETVEFIRYLSKNSYRDSLCEYEIDTNIDSFKNKQHVNLLQDAGYIHPSTYNALEESHTIYVLEDKDIYIREVGHASFDESFLKIIFIKGENVKINLSQTTSCFIFIIANNVYINELGSETFIVADNIFIESQFNLYNYRKKVICAKNMLSIGYGWGVPPFMKTKEELISQNVSIKRDYPTNPHLFLSAGTFLYGCHKDGCALDASLAIPCYNVMKRTMLDWAEGNGIFTPDFWNLKDKDE